MRNKDEKKDGKSNEELIERINDLLKKIEGVEGKK